MRLGAPRAEAALKMLDRIYKLALDGLRQGGSPGGMSKWARRAACGKKYLVWQANNHYDGRHEPFADERNGTRLDHLMVGTIYHVLHEYAHEMPAQTVWDARAIAYTPELKEALRLYWAYVQAFGSLAKRWSIRDLQFEVALEGAPELFNGELVTGRMDAYGFIAEADAQRLELPGEGHYVFDFKTSSKAKDVYTGTPQAKAYMALAQLQFPEHNVRGMVFDQVVKEAKPEFHHYISLPDAGDLAFIQGLVAQGARNVSVPGGRCNAKEEMKVYGGCRCPPEGTFE